MPRYERDTYEPSDEVRIFDGSEEDEDGEGSRLPLLIVLALLVLAMFGGVVWMAYSYGVVHGRTEPREIAAAPGPARIAPASPGAATPYKGFKIYEQPAPADDEADAAPAAAAPTTPTPAEKATPVEAAPAPVAAMPPPAKPAPKPVIAATPPRKTVAKVEAQATAPPTPLGAPVKTTPQPVAVKAVAAPVSGGGAYVQIGAYKSQAIADAAWQSYKAKHATLLSGFDDDVQQVDLGEKGTWYRLRIKGFSTKDAASAMCGRLKADGSSCILAR